MQVIYQAGSVLDAHLVRHALAHDGTPVCIGGEALLGGLGELPAWALLAVCLPESRWPEARALCEGWSSSFDQARADAPQPWPDAAVPA